jgi:hypothetical protein
MLLRYVAWRERLPDLDVPLLVPGIGPVCAALDAVLVTCSEYRHSQARTSVDNLGARLYYRISEKEKAPARPAVRYPQLPLFEAEAPAAAVSGLVLRERRFVTDAGMTRFNRLVEQLLLDDLSRHILREKERGISETEAIYEFIEEAGIADHLEFDTAKKGAWRWRVHYNAPIIRGHSMHPRARPVDQRDRRRVKW